MALLALKRSADPTLTADEKDSSGQKHKNREIGSTTETEGGEESDDDGSSSSSSSSSSGSDKEEEDDVKLQGAQPITKQGDKKKKTDHHPRPHQPEQLKKKAKTEKTKPLKKATAKTSSSTTTTATTTAVPVTPSATATEAAMDDNRIIGQVIDFFRKKASSPATGSNKKLNTQALGILLDNHKGAFIFSLKAARLKIDIDAIVPDFLDLVKRGMFK
jgi:hypothetical protein